MQGSGRRAARWVLWMAPPLLMAGLAWAARHGWVEAQGMGPRCELQPDLWPCEPRQWVIEAFLHHRLSLLALGAAFVGWIRRSAVMACLGACSAAAGLVLYDAGWAAPAFLLSALAGQRALAAADQAASGV